MPHRRIHKRSGKLLIFTAILAGIFGGLILTYTQYRTFALTAKQFTIGDGPKETIEHILTSQFSCPSQPTVSFCRMSVAAPWLAVGFIEIGGVLLVTHRRKRKRRSLVSSILLLQVFAVVLLPIYNTIPTIVIQALDRQAAIDITQAVSVLTDPTKRQSAGIIDSIASISAVLQQNPQPPVFFEYKPQAEAVLQALGIQHNQKDTLYRSIVIAHQAYAKSSLVIPADALLFPTHTLVVVKHNKDMIDPLAIPLVKMLANSAYGQYLTAHKAEPEIRVLTEKEYIDVLQKKKEEEKQKMIGHLAYLRSGLAEIEQALAELATYKNSAPVYYHALIDARIQELTLLRSRYYGVIEQQQEAIKRFEDNPISFEMQAGIFTPPKNIYLKYYQDERVPFSAYLETLLHEYLHYQDNNGSRDLPVFLEEGVTDYLALGVTKNFLAVQWAIASVPNYTGYPEFVSIVKTIAAAVPKEDFLQAYFHRDEQAFKNLINNRFGTGVYDQLKEKTDELYYLGEINNSGRKQLINDIRGLLASPSGQTNQ